MIHPARVDPPEVDLSPFHRRMQLRTDVLRDDLEEVYAQCPAQSFVIVSRQAVVRFQSCIDARIGEVVDRHAVRDLVGKGKLDAFFGCHVRRGMDRRTVWLMVG